MTVSSMTPAASAASPIVVDIGAVLSLEEWRAWVDSETKKLIHEQGMPEDQRLQMVLTEIRDSLVEFGLESSVADSILLIPQAFPAGEVWSVAHEMLAKTRFAATGEDASVPVRERKLVQHLVAEMQIAVQTASAP